MLILFWLSQTWRVTLRIQEKVFSGCTVVPDSKETKLGISNQEASPTADKNTGVVLVPCLHMEVPPYCYFWWCGYFWGPWVSFFYNRWHLSEGHKNYFKDWCLIKSQPTFLFLTFFNTVNYGQGCKLDDFELHNSLKLSFTYIWGRCLNFVDCESFLETNSPYILPLSETNLNDSVNSGNFSERVYLPIIWKDSTTHMHGLMVDVKEGLPFAWDLSLLNSAYSYFSFWLALLHSVSYFFFLYWSPSSGVEITFCHRTWPDVFATWLVINLSNFKLGLVILWTKNQKLFSFFLGLKVIYQQSRNN